MCGTTSKQKPTTWKASTHPNFLFWFSLFLLPFFTKRKIKTARKLSAGILTIRAWVSTFRYCLCVCSTTCYDCRSIRIRPMSKILSKPQNSNRRITTELRRKYCSHFNTNILSKRVHVPVCIIDILHSYQNKAKQTQKNAKIKDIGHIFLFSSNDDKPWFFVAAWRFLHQSLCAWLHIFIEVYFFSLKICLVWARGQLFPSVIYKEKERRKGEFLNVLLVYVNLNMFRTICKFLVQQRTVLFRLPLARYLERNGLYFEMVGIA